jgi:hypothetical protein
MEALAKISDYPVTLHKVIINICLLNIYILFSCFVQITNQVLFEILNFSTLIT